MVLVLVSVSGLAQKPGYYNGTEGKSGTELKTALHEIIKDHVDFSYSDAKYVMNYADEDPANTNNVILLYTKRSQDKDSYGSGNDDINREHVWAKSHGDFSDVRPMDGDAFNLHPSDASVNIARSNYDFDECSDVGTYLAEADAWLTSSQFEPPDVAKGEVARTLFYMAVRYEGTSGELDLEVVDAINTSPNPEHGKLSTLLQWNRDFPPTDLERRRNQRIYECQRNRNPFIDNPEFADLIWGGETASGIVIGDMQLSEDYPVAGSSAVISATITGNTVATLFYGPEWDSELHSASMTASGNTWSADFNLTGFSPGNMVYYRIVAGDGNTDYTVRGSYAVPENKSLTEISAVQGTGDSTPMSGSTVTVGGIVTANLDNSYYIQNGNELRNGICIYDIKRGKPGDSIVITGTPTEFNTLTELTDITYYYVYEGVGLPAPSEITISDADEDYEGMRVLFKNVTFLEGDTQIPVSEAVTLHFTDGIGTMPVYVRYNSRLGGKTVPSGTVNVTGIVSQYQGTYQVLLNSIDDISTGEDYEAPLLTGVVVNDASWIEVSFSEKLEKTSAENISNYTISDGVNISGAYLYNDTKVLLLVTGLRIQDYTLTVTNVTDLQGNAITEATFDFHSDYTSVGIREENANGIRVYPNPAGSFIYLDIPGIKQGTQLNYRLIDLSGKIILSGRIMNTGTIELKLSDVENGLFILQVEAESNVFEKLLFKQKE